MATNKTQNKKTTRAKKAVVEKITTEEIAVEKEIIDDAITQDETTLKDEISNTNLILEDVVVKPSEIIDDEAKTEKKDGNKNVIDPFITDGSLTQVLTATKPNKIKKMQRPIAIEFDTWNGQYIM